MVDRVQTVAQLNFIVNALPIIQDYIARHVREFRYLLFGESFLIEKLAAQSNDYDNIT